MADKKPTRPRRPGENFDRTALHGERLASLEEKFNNLEDQDLDERISTLESWAQVFSAKIQVWFKAGLIIIMFLMSSQVPIVKEIVGILLK